MAEVLALGLQAEPVVFLQGVAVEDRVVVEGEAVQAEVRPQNALFRLAFGPTALNVVKRGGAERQRGVGGITTAADDMDVGGVVGPSRRRHGAIVEDPLLDGQRLAGAGRHQHDVHELLFDDARDDVAELCEAAIANFAGMRFRRLPRSADGQRHIGVLGVGEDEILAAARVRVDTPELRVKRFFHHNAPVNVY